MKGFKPYIMASEPSCTVRKDRWQKLNLLQEIIGAFMCQKLQTRKNFASRNSLTKTVPLARKKLQDELWYALHFQRKNRAHKDIEFRSTVSNLVILYSSMPTSMNDYWNYMFKTIRFTKIVESNLGENILLEFEAQIHEHCLNKMAMQYLVSIGYTIL